MTTNEINGFANEIENKLRNRKLYNDLSNLYKLSYSLGDATIFLRDNGFKNSKLYKRIDVLKLKINNLIDNNLDKMYGEIPLKPL